jgi:hypothetical protein
VSHPICLNNAKLLCRLAILAKNKLIGLDPNVSSVLAQNSLNMANHLVSILRENGNDGDKESIIPRTGHIYWYHGAHSFKRVRKGGKSRIRIYKFLYLKVSAGRILIFAHRGGWRSIVSKGDNHGKGG